MTYQCPAARCTLVIAIVVCSSCGGGETAVATGVMALTGRQIIDDANKAVEDRIHQAEQAASGLVNQTLTGLSALTEAARINLNDSLDRSLAKMDAAQRDVYVAAADAVSPLRVTRFGFQFSEPAEQVSGIIGDAERDAARRAFGEMLGRIRAGSAVEMPGKTAYPAECRWCGYRREGWCEGAVRD